MAEDAASAAARSAGAIEEVIVTAQKREESINEVGMSIQAASGDRLNELGITETADLFKVVSGFNSNVTYYGTQIYTIRGVGFQDTALASGPTVSVYIDQMPLPFSAMTQGATLDLERVEVLKGPQGTLFGQNATGGAVNYIAAKPTDTFEAGTDLSYGRFDLIDLTGFVSGPISETLSYRVAARSIQSGPWQKSYTRDMQLPPDPYWTEFDGGRSYRRDNEHGEQDFLNARASLQWEPNDKLSALFTASGFLDEGDSQMPQLFGFAPLNPVNGLNPLIANYPVSPDEPRAADWGPCVNVSGGSPDNVLDEDFDDNGDVENVSNRLYDTCDQAERDNDFYSLTLRVDYSINEDLTLTSLTSWGDFSRDAKLESDGTIYQDYESSQEGYLEAFFQELRISGSIRGAGTWVVGLNYESTETWDSFLQTYGISTAVPTQVFSRIPLGPTNPNNYQETDTYAAFASFDYPILDELTVLAGVRYTDQKRDYRGCGSDGGDGTWADISVEIQQLLQWVADGFPAVDPTTFYTDVLDAGPGNCASTGPAPDFHPEPAGFTDELDQDNISWRVGANWMPADNQLYYVNVSQGYKSGSFPTVASAAFVQLFPASQEKLLAYEIGTKLALFDQTLQLNSAVFYYDYTDKQILGAINDPIFGSLPTLVNVPDSHVIGGELSLEWYPTEGLRIAPSISYADSEVDGIFRNYDPFFGPTNSDTKDFVGLPFPNVPKWTGNLDVQYEWTLTNGWITFLGANANYQDDTTGFFYDRCHEEGVSCTRTDVPGLVGDPKLEIKERTLVDLRAGFEHGNWRIWAWGRNVTDEHYWNQAQHVNDVLLRFTGMPATYGISASLRTGG
jgi:outer membrane receptor protein involved in Fe transport